MDRKTDYVCEIQDNFCGRGMVIMKLNLVKGKTENQSSPASTRTESDGYLNHVTKVLKGLVDTQMGKVDIFVAPDSQFSSVKYEKALGEMALGFIGVVNQAPHEYKMEHLQRK